MEMQNPIGTNFKTHDALSSLDPPDQGSSTGSYLLIALGLSVNTHAKTL